MQLRKMTGQDMRFLNDIDATLDVVEYLHVDHTFEGLTNRWLVEPRPLRPGKSLANTLSDDDLFDIRQVAEGAEDGFAMVADHDGQLVAALVARNLPQEQLIELLTIRVDFDFRRQGIATAAMFQLVNHAKEQEARAVRVVVTTDNAPACHMFAKLGFVLSGIDTRRKTNHDLVKEQASLVWYLPMD